MWKKIKYSFWGDFLVQLAVGFIIFFVGLIPAIFDSGWKEFLISVFRRSIEVYQLILFLLVVLPVYWYFLKTKFRRQKIGPYSYIELVDILESEKTNITGGRIPDENLLILFIAMYSLGSLSRPISAQDVGEVNLWAYRTAMKLDAYGLVKKEEVPRPSSTTSVCGVQYSLSEDGKHFYAMIRKRNLYNEKNKAKYDTWKSRLSNVVSYIAQSVTSV